MGYVSNEIDKRVVAHLRRLMQTRQDISTRYKLAIKVGVDDTTLYKIFSGSRGVNIDLLYALHRKLGISADALLDDDPEPKYFKPGPDENRRGRRPPATAGPPVSQPPAPGQGPNRRRGHG